MLKKGRFTHSGMAGAVRHDYARHGKLKSNVMKQNKSPIRRMAISLRVVKRMTGNIEALGKGEFQ